MKLLTTPINRKKARIKDLTILSTLVGGSFILSSHFDLFEKFNEITRAHESWNLDEIILPIGIAIPGLIACAYREIRRYGLNYVLSLFNSSPDLAITIDNKLNTVFVSAASEKLLGYTPEELIEIPIKKQMTPESYEKIEKILEKYPINSQTKVPSGSVFKVGILEYICINGETLPMEVQSTPHFDSKGKLTYIINIARDVTEEVEQKEKLKQLNAKLEALTLTDDLTGLGNRKKFHLDLEQSLKYAKRYEHTRGLLYIDLNQFKLANDTYGHKTGDEILKTVASRIKENIRETDEACRLGGDEFAVILKNFSKNQYETIAQRVYDALEQPYRTNKGTIKNISGSIGVSLFPHHTKTADELTHLADQAMYKAKKENLGICIHS